MWSISVPSAPQADSGRCHARQPPPYLRVQASLIFRISPGQNMARRTLTHTGLVVVHPAIAHDAPCVANPLGRLATEL